MMEEEPPQPWQQRVLQSGRAFFKKAGEVLVTVATTPIPCQRCGQKFLLLEYFSYERDRTVHSIGGYEVPLVCCSACFEELKAAAQRQRLLARYNQLVAREDRRVWKQLERARKRGNAATLTLEQWLFIVGQFGWKCGYCGGPFEAMEHFYPISRGGGTSADNVLPVCNDCNSWKTDRLPEDIKETVRSPEAVRRVAAKLAQLQLALPASLPPTPLLVSGDARDPT